MSDLDRSCVQTDVLQELTPMLENKEEAKLQIWYANACTAYKNSDNGRWEAARWCAKIVGKYEKGATIGLADDMGVSYTYILRQTSMVVK